MTMRVVGMGRARLLGAICFAVLALGFPRPAAPAEIAVLYAGASPGSWSSGWGGTLTISFFDLVHAEVEGIYQGNDLADTHLGSVTGKAYLGPTIGRLIPYAGLGVGGYQESYAGTSDDGKISLLFVGAKLKFPVGLVLRGEYQWVSLASSAPLKMDSRYFFSAGLRF